MNLLLKIILMIAGVLAITLPFINDPGYLMMHWHGYIIEMAVAVAALIVLAIIVSICVLVYFWFKLRRFPRRLGSWREHRRTDKAARALSEGLVELAEGNWQKAEKQLVRYSAASETPLLNYLAASRAAQGQGAWERRDAYLKQAIEAMPDAGIAVGLTQAEMQLHHGQLEQALASARHLKQIAPKHHYVTRLLVDIYRQLGDWRQFLDHLQQLHKSQVYDQDEYDQQLRTGFCNLLRDKRETPTVEEVQKVWERMPQSLRIDEDMVRTYTVRLMQLEQGQYAEPVVRAALDKEWREGLVELYGVLPGDAASLLQAAQRWQRSHPGDPVLLLTLGRLHMRQQIWGKARQLLEESISHGGGGATHILLAELLDRLDEKERARDLFRRGLQEYIKEKEAPDPVDRMLIFELSAQDRSHPAGN